MKVFRSPKTRLLFRLVIGLAILGVLLLILERSYDLQDILDAFRVFPLAALPILLLISFIVNALKAVRFHILVRHVDLPIEFWQTFKLFFASLAATPIPAGETIRAALLKREVDAPLGRVASPVIGQAIYEVAAAVIVIAGASAVYPEFRVPAIVISAFFLAFMLLTLHKATFSFFVRLMSRFAFVHKRAERIYSAHEDLRQHFTILGDEGFDRHTIAAMFAAMFAQVAGGLLVYVAAHSASVNLDFLQSSLIYASGAILQGVFTFIPGGLGVTEGGMSGVLHLLGVELTVALALVVIIRLATLLFPVLLGLVVFFLFYAKQTLLPKDLDDVPAFAEGK